MRDELDHHSLTMSPFLSNFRPSLMKKQLKVKAYFHKLTKVRKKKKKIKLSVNDGGKLAHIGSHFVFQLCECRNEIKKSPDFDGTFKLLFVLKTTLTAF